MSLEGASNFYHPARTVTSGEMSVGEQREPFTPEQFLEKLYDRTIDWFVQNEGGEIIAELEPQKVRHWDSHQADPGRITTLSLELKKGVLARSKKFDFALTLGNRCQTKWDSKPCLSLQFGITNRPLIRTEDKMQGGIHPDIDIARMLVSQKYLTYGSGQFYIDDYFNKVMIDCWADHRTFGGPMIRDWPTAKLLTAHGVKSCVEIVKRTAERAFI